MKYWGFVDNSWSYEDGVLTIPEKFNESFLLGEWGYNESSIRYIRASEIIITEQITEIPEYTFGFEVEKITIPSSVNNISEFAFYYSSYLADIVINGENASYVCENGILFDKNKTELIVYLKGNTAKEYTIPASVLKICGYAFHGCARLETVNIGAKVENIGNLVFDDCDNLRDINVDPDNELYYSIEGVLYGNYGYSFSADYNGKTTLLKCPPKNRTTELVVPEGVAIIGTSSCVSCKNLETVQLPDSVTIIGTNAFGYCINLKNVTFPQSLKYAEAFSFIGCASLEEIVIPANAEMLGLLSFVNCPNLKKVTVLSKYVSLDDSWISSENSKDTVIYGIKGSTAEKYASANGFEFVELDVEGIVSASIQGYWLKIGDSITMNCQVRNFEELTASDSMYLEISVGGDKFTVIHDGCYEMRYGVGYDYYFDLPAVQMTDAITVRLIVDGVEMDTNILSLKQYADVILENKNNLEYYEKAKPLVKAILNYGGYVQDYFGYNTDNKANDGLFAEGEDPVLAGNDGIITDDRYKTEISASNSSLEYYGMSLVCLGKTEMKLYFKITDRISASEIMKKYDFSVSGLDEDRFSVEEVSSKMLVVRIKGITFANIDDIFNITVSPAGSSVTDGSEQNADSISLEISPMNYIYKTLNNDGEALQNLSKALYYLNYEADKYTVALHN